MTKTVLITGASSGIGLEFAKIFAKKGDNVILVARNEEKLVDIKNILLKNIIIPIVFMQKIYLFQTPQRNCLMKLHQMAEKLIIL